MFHEIKRIDSALLSIEVDLYKEEVEDLMSAVQLALKAVTDNDEKIRFLKASIWLAKALNEFDEADIRTHRE